MVGRLSLRFKTEDPLKFEERVEICKKRQQNADDEMRFLKYIDSLDDKEYGFLNEPMRLKIEKFVNNKKRENHAPSIQQLRVNLMKQIKFEYV